MQTQTIRPLGNRVLVKRDAFQTSKGGILLPDSAKEKPRRGEILAMGPGKMDENGTIQPLNLSVGDKILFGSYAGVEVKNGEFTDGEYLILTEDEILGIIG